MTSQGWLMPRTQLSSLGNCCGPVKDTSKVDFTALTQGLLPAELMHFKWVSFHIASPALSLLSSMEWLGFMAPVKARQCEVY